MRCALLQTDIDVLDNILLQNAFGPVNAGYHAFLKDVGTVRAERIDSANIMRQLTNYLPVIGGN